MRISAFLVTFLFALPVLLATDAVAKGEVYRWVDASGVVHFGDQPDSQANSEVVTIKNDPGNSAPAYSAPPPTTSGEQELSAAQQKRAERAEKRQEAAEKQQAVAAGCAQRRQLVADLEPSPRVIVEYEDGTVGRLDDNERLEMLAEANAYIAKNCDN